jgi:cobalt/nickel transport system permease protein
MAIGCNLINIAIVPGFVGYWIYTLCMHNQKLKPSGIRTIIAVMLSCQAAVLFASALIPIQAALSGVLMIPFATFLTTMLGVHTVIGLLEGLITIAIFAYLHKVSPELFDQLNLQPPPAKRKKLYTAIIVAIIITAAALSLAASSLPDGLEWSYAQRPDQPDFTPITSNTSTTVENADQIQDKISLMPDYNSALPLGWKSFAGVTGSLITMATIWIAACFIRKKGTPANASHTH